MKSMTGFGRAEKEEDNRNCSIEIKTVNNRYKDINVRMPPVLNALDLKIRNLINGKIDRGKVDIFVNYKNLNQSNELVVNENLAKSYSQALDELLNYNTLIEASIDLADFGNFPDIIMIKENREDTDDIWGFLEPILKEAITNLVKSREIEGANLKNDIKNHLIITQNLLEEIKELAPESIKESQKKLKERLELSTAEVELDESRFLTEVAVLADKLAIDEEITRLDSHLNQLDELIEKEGSIGRKMDFLIQEVNREINTIGSKTDNFEIKTDVVDMKAEVEKIREQVQNIE